MKNLTLFLFIIVSLFIKNVTAQDFAKKGIWEVAGRINYTSTTSVNNGITADNSLDAFSLHTPVYYFIIDGLAVGFIPGYENLSYGGSSSSILNLEGGIAYNFETESVAYPYIEGRFGFNTSSNGNTRNGIIWSLGGGVKIRIGGNVLIGFGLDYEQRTLESSDNIGGRDGSNSFGIDIGFAVFFGQ